MGAVKEHIETSTTRSAAETEALAERIAKGLKGGETIELISDLGGGKTTFVRGLARGLGSDERVASPTFTVSKVYQAKGKALHHFDFYRLTEAGMVAHELAEVVADPRDIVVVEWGDVVQDVLPENRITVRIQNKGEQERAITVRFPEDRA